MTRSSIFSKRLYIFGGIIVIAYLIGTTTIVEKLFYHNSNINLSDGGGTYNNYYTQDGDFIALKWLEKNRNPTRYINLDKYVYLRATAYTNINDDEFRRGLLPTQVQQRSYVYANSINVNEGIAYDTYKGKTFSYNFPEEFLSYNKNNLYTNGQSRIYQ